MTPEPLLALLPAKYAQAGPVLWRRITTALTYREIGAEFGRSGEWARCQTERALHGLRVWYAGNPALRATRTAQLQALCRPYPDLYAAVFGEAPEPVHWAGFRTAGRRSRSAAPGPRP